MHVGKGGCGKQLYIEGLGKGWKIYELSSAGQQPNSRSPKVFNAGHSSQFVHGKIRLGRQNGLLAKAKGRNLGRVRGVQLM